MQFCVGGLIKMKFQNIKQPKKEKHFVKLRRTHEIQNTFAGNRKKHFGFFTLTSSLINHVSLPSISCHDNMLNNQHGLSIKEFAKHVTAVFDQSLYGS